MLEIFLNFKIFSWFYLSGCLSPRNFQDEDFVLVSSNEYNSRDEDNFWEARQIYQTRSVGDIAACDEDLHHVLYTNTSITIGG